MLEIIKPHTNINFIGKLKYTVILSALVILGGLFSIVSRGGLNYGVDFSGGTLIQVRFSQSTTASEIKKGLEPLNAEGLVVQNFGGGDNSEFLIRASGLPESLERFSDQTLKLLQEAYPNGDIEVRRSETVGPKISASLRKKGFWAVILSILGMLIYITWRFEFRFGVGAVVALTHDVLVTLAAVSIKGIPVDLSIVAAFLTVVGYSVNDTIVVSDRIRENFRKLGTRDETGVINKSINETLGRTILTSGVTLLSVLALYFFGGGVIQDFAFALLVGFFAGVYSTIYIASPVVLLFKKKKK
jgi:preprotein translocase subunit SecF